MEVGPGGLGWGELFGFGGKSGAAAAAQAAHSAGSCHQEVQTVGWCMPSGCHAVSLD